MEHIDHLLPDYLTGHLSESDSIVVEEHLKHCTICQEEHRELGQAFSSIQQRQFPAPEQQYFINLLPVFHQRQAKTVRGIIPAKIIQLIMPLSAVLVILMLIVLLPHGKITTSEEGELHTILAHTSNDELAAVAAEQDTTSIAGGSHEIASVIVEERLSDNHLMKDVMRSDCDVLNGMEIETVVNDFDTKQIDEVLMQLKERKRL